MTDPTKTNQAAAAADKKAMTADVIGHRRLPVATRTGGHLLFGYFLLAKQEKVTCRRATPRLGSERQGHRI